VASLAGIVEESRVIFQPMREGLGQAAARLRFPEQDVGDGIAGFLTRIPGL
jgi:hypothetical protein